MAAAAPWIMLGLAGAQTYSQVKQGQEQKKATQRATQQQEAELAKLDTQRAADEAKASANADRARQATDLQRRRATAGGRASTILTGGQGLTTAAPTQYKTLLGM
jgi:hypothetical protein